ncbi:MAG: helix-turn-helix transcriptional regulator [Clostridia bacterium]|nr:helix-turn-helix transcriptional regulator [Clostridia bacterium]
MNSEIGKQIKQYRLCSGMTQNDVSVALGINRSTYARQEAQGKFSPEIAVKLAALFHVTPAQILYGEPESVNMQEYLNATPQRAYAPLRLNAGEPDFLNNNPMILTNNERNFVRIIRDFSESQLQQLEDFIIDLRNQNQHNP